MIAITMNRRRTELNGSLVCPCSSITLKYFYTTTLVLQLRCIHLSSERSLSHNLKEKVKLVGQRRVNFKGIMGRKVTIVADVYKWNLGWIAGDSSVPIFSAEMPSELVNLDGMLLGRDTIYRYCWELSYKRFGDFNRPFVPTPKGPAYLVSSNGSELLLHTQYDGLEMTQQQSTMRDTKMSIPIRAF